MCRRGPFQLGIALAFVLVAQHTLAVDVCRTGCRGASQTFKYAQGTTYKYNYEGKIDITLSSAEGQATSTEVKSVVLLTQEADCNQILRLQNVQIFTQNGKKHGNIPDVEKPIRINFHDGHIEDSICTEPGESENSLNIKRAIASLFQINPKNRYETDVFGLCPTETSQQQEGNVLVVHKSRDLNKCAYRENFKQDFFSTTFNPNSEIKSSPLISGDYKAKLKIKNGILDQASSIENYLYVPFSVGNNGAKAQVTSKLQLTGTSKDIPRALCNKPKSIIFEDPNPVAASSSNVNTILNAVKEVTKTINIIVGEDTGKEFITLIKTVRAAKKADLLAVYNQVKSGAGLSDKVAAKRAFLDAILQSGTADAVEVLITLLKNNELNDVEKKLAFIGMSIVRYATDSSLIAATALLNQRNLPYEAYLGIGNLAGRYCRQRSCETDDAVNKLIQKLAQKLGNGKAANKQVENDIIFILKALGNFGFISDSILPKVIAIAQDKKAANRLRAVALETYLADPCKDKLRNSALSILQDIQQDSEIRIKAYLVVAQCPNAKVGNAIKAMLVKEPSIQVGGFIVSSIRNIKASANPDKDLAKQYLGFSVPRKFPIDARKWSFNHEFSYAVDTLGIGASTEGNIIYSQDSFLPRATSLNLTAQIFGHTLNFLEIKTRQENLDKLIEHYFGPKGVLRSSSLSELLQSGDQLASKLFNYLNKKLVSTLRARRDISRAEINNIGKAVLIKENALNKDLDLDLSVKAFGTEVMFTNLNIFQTELSPEKIIDTIIARFSEGLDSLKNFKETYRNNMLLLDAELDYPTGLGFPLRLAVEGTSNVQVKAEGSIDVRALLHKHDSNIHIQLIPSASIEIAGRLTLDAFVVENGLKVSSNLYTATGGDLTVNLFNGCKGLDIKFGLPVQEQKIISANHEIVFHTRDQSGHETNLPLKFAQVKDFSICLDQLSPFIGLAFCAEVNGPTLAGKDVPVLPFPLAGDAKFSVTIENEDVSEYHIRKTVNDEFTSAEIVVETIGKNRQKKVSFQVNAEISPENYIKAVFNSPIKSASAEAHLTDNAHEKSLMIKLSQDQNEFYGKIGIGISGSPTKFVYKPILDYRAPGGVQQLPLRVEGQIIVERNGDNTKYIYDNVKLTLPNNKIFTLQGNVGVQGQDFVTDLTLSDGQQSASLNGLLHVTADLVKVNTEFKNTANPSQNFNLKVELMKQIGQYSSSLQLIHGTDLASKTNIITLTNSITRKYNGHQDFTFGTENKFSYPLLGIDTEFDFKQTPRTIDYDFDFQYNDIKFGFELELEVNKKTRGDFDVEFEAYGLENRVDLKANRVVREGDESKINYELDINGKKMEVKGTLKHNIKPSNVNVGADLTVILPTHPTPFNIDSGLLYNPSEIDAYHKVTSGSTTVIDAFIKANKNGNANGSVKISIKDILVVNGQLKSNKGNGNGHILIDAQSIKRQVKLETAFQVQPSSAYNVILTLYPNFGKDNSQKMVLSTHNKITPDNIDTKNSIDILNKKLELNVKITRSGDEKVNGEFEVILPNNQYLLGKINRDFTKNNDVFDGVGVASLEYRKNKNAAGRKVSVKGTYRNINPKEGLFDVTYNLAADDSNGKNINADIGFKNLKVGATRTLEVSNKLYGSIISQPLIGLWRITCTNGIGNYEASASYGPQSDFIAKGSYDLQGQENPLTGNVKLRLITPNTYLRELKFEWNGKFKRSLNPTDEWLVNGYVSLYADDDGTVNGPIVDFKGDGTLSLSDTHGRLESEFDYNSLGHITTAASYKRSGSGKPIELSGSVDMTNGEHKVKISGTLSRPDENQYTLDGELDTSYDNYRKTKWSVNTVHSEDYKNVRSKVLVNADGKVWNLDSEFQSSDLSPLINVKLICPEGKLSQFYIKGNNVGEKEFAGEIKIVHQKKNFLLEGNLEANIDNIDEFYIKANINSPTLDLNKISFDAHNKPGKTGRRIQVVIKSTNKNIVTGSTSYQAREEHGKFIVEGSGSFKLKEETTAANFKYICQHLSSKKDGEQGVEVSFDAGLGDKAIDAELKVTNKQFRLLNSYCEKKKECAHVEIDSKINNDDIQNYNHVLEINIDLRKLGASHACGLKSVTDRKDYILDHTVDVHFQGQENSKYQYSVYLHPKEAGVSFTTPKRVISLEAIGEVPKNYQRGGKVSGEVAFYLDKKNTPNLKASINGWLTIDATKKTINGETKITHPGLTRVLSASIKTVNSGTPTNGEITVISTIDIFKQPGQKIVSTYKYADDFKPNSDSLSYKQSLFIKSSGLGVDIQLSEDFSLNKQALSGEYDLRLKYHVGNSNYDNVLSTKGGKTHSNFLLRVLNVDLLSAHHKLDFNKERQVIDSEISSYNNNPLITHLEIKNFNTLLYTVGFKNTPREKIQVNSGFIPGQIADIRADHVTGSGKINLYLASLKLDDANFLKPDYSINSKEIENVLEQTKKKFSDYLTGLTTLGDNWSNDIRKEVTQLGEISKKAAPNLQPLRQYYTSEVDKIRKEILEDKSIKELGDLLNNIFGAIVHIIAEVVGRIGEIVEGLVHSFQTTFAGVIDSIDKDLIPQMKELSQKLIDVAVDSANTAIEIVAGYLATVGQMIEKYQPEIKELAAVFSELGQDVGRFIQKSYAQVRGILTDLCKRVYSEIQALPIFEELKAQYEEFVKNGLPNAEGIIGGLREIAATINDLIPPDFIVQKEISQLIDMTLDYLEKRVKSQPVDDFAVFNQWTQIFFTMIRKLLNTLSTPEYEVNQTDIPVSFDILKKLPKLVAIKFSPIAQILRDDTSEEITTFLLTLINNPRQWFAPFPLFGMVIQGQHIFTFDEKHLTFPGNCKYLLARDAVNGNFTLIGTYVSGSLNAITLADQNDAITLKKTGQVLLNNVVSEFPIRKPDIAAWRTYEMVFIKSTAGITVECTPSLSACGVYLSGFYHAQVKGLLGVGNNEPYDDFTMANGKIVTDEAEFGNSYKMGVNCPQVTTPKHDHLIDQPECNDLFGWESPMRYCYPFVNTDNFKMACAHGLAAKVKQTEVAIAAAYVGACNQRNIPISIPPRLVSCTNGDKAYSVGDKFSIKVPAKAADIVLLVDTIKRNEQVYKELVQPLVTEITKTLQSKGINDIEFHLITYGGENQWPSHVTVNGKLTFKGKAPNVKFSEGPSKEPTYSSLHHYIDALENIIHDVNLATGQDLAAKTYSEGYDYPFRAHATKSIIAVTSRPCEVGKLYVLQKLRAQLYKDEKISLNLITPFEGLSVKDAKKTKEIVGFNDERVFTVSQGKKKPEGSAELYKELQYDDYCVDFTVKNRGNVYVADNFIQGKPDIKKQFIHVAAYNIVDKLTNIEEGLDCECKMYGNYAARNVCREVYAKEKPAKKASVKA